MNRNMWIAVALTTANFIFKLLYLGANDLAGDEPFSVYHAQMDVVSIIKQLATGNNPPLYEIILHFWIKLFGISEFAVRFPSLIFSTVTCLFLYKIGQRFINQSTGITASILFIFSNYQIFFAHEARTYALVGMLTALSMYCFLYLTAKSEGKGESRSRKLYLTVLLLANTLLIYAHYFGMFVLFVQFLYVVSDKTLRTKHGKHLLLCAGIILILYTPNLHVLLTRFLTSSSQGTWVKAPNGPESLYVMLWQFSNTPVVTVSVVILLTIAVIKFLLKDKFREISTANKIIITWFTLPFFLMFFASFWIPMFMDRYLMVAAVGFHLVVAIALNYLSQTRIPAYLLPAIICGMFVFTAKPDISNKRQTKATVEKIKELKTENTLVYICPDWFILNFVYYYNIDCFKDFHTEDIYHNIRKHLEKEHIFSLRNDKNIKAIHLQNADKVLYLDAAADLAFPENNILKRLNLLLEQEKTYSFYEIFTIYEFRKKTNN